MGRLCDKNQEIKIPYPHLNVFMCVDMLFLFLFLVILTHVSGPITPLIHQSGGALLTSFKKHLGSITITTGAECSFTMYCYSCVVVLTSDPERVYAVLI